MSRPLEATSHAVLQAVNDAIISCDIEGVVVTWNREAEALYGYTALEAIGSSLDIISTMAKVAWWAWPRFTASYPNKNWPRKA